ncbi:jg13712 [Pararge aegeria aegeria]|uniref:Jg13712 protein n=1 Tax=Pararge aegeria aegeria TaxID=348720 RepID=A0A8S4RNM4_9NEOP|nr:jg13712 [Pararge aegeria aegeria]
MSEWHHRTDAIHWYMQELSSRVVAESGIPGDRYHLGKLTLRGLKDAPDFLLQIDGATDERENFGSALKRSVQCANAFRKFGVKQGDVIILMAPNHIHLTMPMYAAFYLGIAVSGIDCTLGVVWGGSNKTSLLRLERAQRAILKVITKKPYRYPTIDLYKDCKVLSEVMPNTKVMVMYGLSELSGMAFNYDGCLPTSLGRPIQSVKARLVDPATLEDITEPNVTGELWVKGPTVFKGYYNKPDITAQALVEGGWLRTGDMMYRDAAYNFYYVDRLKLLLKYRNHQISPLEIENVIIKHPDVFEVAVTGVKHEEHGDLPVACVVLYEGSKVTAQEIKDFVKGKVAEKVLHVIIELNRHM